MEERLQKIIAQSGLCSRRKAETLISEGVVSVNGKIVTELGFKVTNKDIIKVNGKEIMNQPFVYILMNKPRNTISSVRDDRGRETIVDIIKKDNKIKERIFPVGRLDYDTTGAILLTNDGNLSNKLTHPSFEIEKVYIASVEGKILEEDIEKIASGVILNNKKTQPREIKIIKYNSNQNRTIARIKLHEGMNREVKRMFEAIGKKVIKLNRESFAGLTTKGLYEGQHRLLTKEEITYLKLLTKK